MPGWVLWIILIVAIVIASLAGLMTVGTFIRAQEICPSFFDCEDAREASFAFSIVTFVGAIVAALAWCELGLQSRKVDAK
jgi:hypothetical protein